MEHNEDDRDLDSCRNQNTYDNQDDHLYDIRPLALIQH